MDGLVFNEDGILIIGKSQHFHEATTAYNNGVEAARKGNMQEAIAFFEHAIAIGSDFIDAHYNLAVTYYTLERFEEAQKEYEIVIERRPNDVDALNNLGTIFALSNQLERAKELFDKALKIDDGFALTHRNLAAYYQQKGNITKTAEHVRRARELDENVFDREPGPPRKFHSDPE